MKKIKIHPESFKIQLTKILVSLAISIMFIVPVMNDLAEPENNGNPAVAALFLLVAFVLFCIAVHFAFKMHRSTH